MPAKSLELQHTIRLIRELDTEITDIETAIQAIMEELRSPITTTPGMGLRMGAMILAEVGDFSRFDSPDKLLTYAGLSPSTYQSGQLNNCYAHMCIYRRRRATCTEKLSQAGGEIEPPRRSREPTVGPHHAVGKHHCCESSFRGKALPAEAAGRARDQSS